MFPKKAVIMRMGVGADHLKQWGVGPTGQTPDFNWVELGDIGERHG